MSPFLAGFVGLKVGNSAWQTSLNPLCSVGTFNCSTVIDVTQDQCNALVDLYNSTDGPHWTDSNGWEQSPYVSNWTGVILDTGAMGSKQVIGLDLHQNNLS